MVGVVLSVGITILDLSIKQIQLSTNAKESELAFQAANAGMECARYWRRAEADDMESGNPITPTCFDTTTFSNDVNDTTPAVDDTSDSEAHFYEFSFTWGTGLDERCTEIDIVVASTSPFGDGIEITNMTAMIPGFPDGTNKTCEPGTKCSTISVRGYNRPCGNIDGFGVVQREVLLEF